jgi:hypothetical protein
VRTFLASAYVTAYRNTYAHLCRGARLLASVRFCDTDKALHDIPTCLCISVLSYLSADVLPSELAFDLQEDGSFVMRLASASEWACQRNKAAFGLAEDLLPLIINNQDQGHSSSWGQQPDRQQRIAYQVCSGSAGTLAASGAEY